ncbi:DUF3025 domain-containing protein [Polaromonas sp.]|uniref:DUF3025 domain-containing protein n=1 Tax=Polaromonas sp. TaxID=1869339 RepID=UPI002BBCD8D0|nr:DUF3025 domain-containing protein [Polaromonas sp.]HQS33200.1 DUF3025 domain-containing protein [Polaromonas sp.]HQS90463.1 DUF3025 domain-containing protein [Polaromonas sp.]
MSTPIDWSRPWLQHLRESGEQVAKSNACGLSLHQALSIVPGTAIRFGPQHALPAGQAYEQFIFETSTVPTRDNLHDFFNGLCWITFPQTKKKLNQLQAAEIAKAGVQPLRGPVRDALTVFDENAAFLIAPQPLWDALLARDWKMLFITLRPLWKDAQLVLFGHALLEKLVYPRKAITAHVYRAQSAMNSIASLGDLDASVAAGLSAGGLAAKPFTPLPVLGVPGWWLENENFSFYEDSTVFRPIQTTKTRSVSQKPLPNPLI